MQFCRGVTQWNLSTKMRENCSFDRGMVQRNRGCLARDGGEGLVKGVGGKEGTWGREVGIRWLHYGEAGGMGRDSDSNLSKRASSMGGTRLGSLQRAP